MFTIPAKHRLTAFHLIILCGSVIAAHAPGTCAAEGGGAMTKCVDVKGYTCTLEFDGHGGCPELHVQFAPADSIPIVDDAKLVMDFTDGSSLRQGIPMTNANVPITSKETLRVCFQPEGISGTEKLLKAKPDIASFSFRIKLQVPIQWETRTLPKITDWLAENEKLGETRLSIGNWKWSQYYRTRAGETNVIPFLRMEIYTVGPAVGREVGIGQGSGFRLRTPDGHLITSKSYLRMKRGNSTWRYSLDFEDKRTLNFERLGELRLEVFVPGEGFQQTRPLKELLPPQIEAGQSRLLLVPGILHARRPDPLEHDEFEMRPFAFGIVDRLKGFENTSTGEIRRVEDAGGIHPYERISLGSSAEPFLNSPNDWRPIFEVPTKIEVVELEHTFEEVNWP